MTYEISENIINQLKKADELCGREILSWLASLYDPKTGGFYYSVSARDSDRFFPDLESTYQAVYLLQLGGMYETGIVPEKIMPKEIQDGFVRFAREMQDETDGYFYHPQWGKKLGTPRKNRDLMWAKALLGKFGGAPKYLLPDERISKSQNMSASETSDVFEIEERFSSKKKFIEYLDSMNWESGGWGSGNALASQLSQIKAADLFEIANSYLCEKQNKETGLWGNGLTYAATNAAMKISAFFTPDSPYPNFDKMLESVIYIIKNEGIPIYITDVWNPLVTINQAKHTYGDFSGIPEALQKKLLDALPEIIRISVENAKLFKKNDGAFGYNRLTGQETSQGMTVSAGANESDINGTLAACTSMRSALWSLVGLKSPAIYKDDAKYFMNILMQRRREFSK